MKLSLNRSQVLIIALCLCLCVNTYYHANTPAYRAYVSLCTRLENVHKEYYNYVHNQLIPIITNSYYQISQSCNTTAPTSAPLPVGGVGVGAGNVVKPRDIDSEFIIADNCSVCTIGNNICVYDFSDVYYLGDFYLGSPIKHIDKNSFILADGRKYRINKKGVRHE